MSKVLPVALIILLLLVVCGALFLSASGGSTLVAPELGFEEITQVPRGSDEDPTQGGLRGRVVDEEGNPVSGIEVHYLSSPMAMSLERSILQASGAAPAAITDGDGRFEATAMKPGNVQVLAMDDPVRRAALSALVPLRAGQTSVGLQLSLVAIDPRRILAGTVIDSQGNPAPYANVGISYDSFLRSGSAQRSTDQQGRFFFLLPAGMKVQVSASKEGLGKVELESRVGEPNLEVQLQP